MIELSESIKSIKGIGDKTAQCFARLNIYTVRDLIYTYPRNYLTYDEPVSIGEVKEGERCAVFGVISTYVEVHKLRTLKLTTLSIRDSSGVLRLAWFNCPFLRNVFHKGDSYVFVGTIKYKNGSRVMEMPEYYKKEQYQKIKSVMQPIYPLTSGLSNKTIQKAVGASKEAISTIEDYIPLEIRQEYGIMGINDALLNVHFPLNESILKDAIRRLAFDEFYRFLIDMGRLRQENIRCENTHKIIEGKFALEFIDRLPYRLTRDQGNAIDDILNDMGSENVMNRLLQGDVGSGKTIVAVTVIAATVKAGWQAALMVPTEVLARQHYIEMRELLGEYGIRVECLVGSTPIKDKRRIYEGISDGSVDVVVGTHALIQEKVSFKDLALVVTDEQHRFGVNQRKALSNKGSFPHTLVMSATPIPRTLAIIIYADLDISVINQMPSGRKAIKNCVVGTDYRETAYRFIDSQIKEGSQAYVICPMVEESDTMDLTNVASYTDTLRLKLSPEARVASLHGQMKAEEKNQIMQDFADGKIDVLVSTTVIEVGINNPNATVMMIENAERFGLAQLHQLRGRVGRGKKQSYCIFINGKESKESEERLRVLENSNDGFFIASEDLKQRGPGDFFGIRQSGDVLFSLADIYNHADMLKLAQDIIIKYGDTLLRDDLNREDINTVL